MATDKRLTDLERATRQQDRLTVINLSWGDEVIVNGESMTRAAFAAAYPDYDPQAGEVIALSWGEDYSSEGEFNTQ